ncbi:MAG TPA: zinc-ribbon and DUF3426 domain-containing protein [Methylophilaceae bacterium]
MSLVTTCPACGTMFKVQRDQLAAGTGEGRCSVCQHVFNAFEHQSEIPDDAVENVSPAPQAQSFETPPAVSEAESIVPEAPLVIEAEMPAPLFTTPPTLPENLFKRRRFVWPAALKTLTAVMVLLAIAVVQSAFHYRTHVIEKLPRSYPVFAAVCQLFGCSVALPHQAALVNIEDHRLLSDPLHDDVLILESTLDNRAEFPQVYPLIELTLMDANNQAVATRTFRPQEYLPNNLNIASGLAAHATVPIRLTLGVAGIKSSSYQLLTKDEAPPAPVVDTSS